MSRLLNASYLLRVQFVENGQTQEFVAGAEATRQKPMVVDVRRDPASHKDGAGGKITLESRDKIHINRREIPALDATSDALIEVWLENKRREMRAQAASLLQEGALTVKIDPEGEVVAGAHVPR